MVDGVGGDKFSIGFYVIKRYLAYRAEPPFAAISGTMLSWDSRVDSASMLCAGTWAPASARGSRRAVERRSVKARSALIRW